MAQATLNHFHESRPSGGGDSSRSPVPLEQSIRLWKLSLRCGEDSATRNRLRLEALELALGYQPTPQQCDQVIPVVISELCSNDPSEILPKIIARFQSLSR